jgi:hypothetical protein
MSMRIRPICKVYIHTYIKALLDMDASGSASSIDLDAVLTSLDTIPVGTFHESLRCSEFADALTAGRWYSQCAHSIA